MEYIMYGVRELQANLGKALRAVERGQRVIITSRRRPVAVLAKIDGPIPRESAVDRKIRRLAAEGRIRLGERKPILPFKAPALDGLSKQVTTDRQ